MTAGLATIRRGIGFGGLSTLSRGYLGAAILALLIACPPEISMFSMVPAAAVQALAPQISMGSEWPNVELNAAPAPTIELQQSIPDISIGGCC